MIKKALLVLLVFCCVGLTHRYVNYLSEYELLKTKKNEAIGAVDKYKSSIEDAARVIVGNCENFLAEKYKSGVFEVNVAGTGGMSSRSSLNLRQLPVRDCSLPEDSYLIGDEGELRGVIAHCDAGLLGYTKAKLAAACKVDAKGEVNEVWLVYKKLGFPFHRFNNEYELRKSSAGVHIWERPYMETQQFPFDERHLSKSKSIYENEIERLDNKTYLPSAAFEVHKRREPSLVTLLLIWVVTFIFINSNWKRNQSTRNSRSS